MNASWLAVNVHVFFVCSWCMFCCLYGLDKEKLRCVSGGMVGVDVSCAFIHTADIITRWRINPIDDRDRRAIDQTRGPKADV